MWVLLISAVFVFFVVYGWINTLALRCSTFQYFKSYLIHQVLRWYNKISISLARNSELSKIKIAFIFFAPCQRQININHPKAISFHLFAGTARQYCVVAQPSENQTLFVTILHTGRIPRDSKWPQVTLIILPDYSQVKDCLVDVTLAGSAPPEHRANQSQSLAAPVCMYYYLMFAVTSVLSLFWFVLF